MKKIFPRYLVACITVFSFIVMLIGGNGAVSAVLIEYTANSSCKLFSGDGLWHYCYLIDDYTSDTWHNYTGSLSGSVPWGDTNLSWSITISNSGFRINLPSLPRINEIFTMTSFGDGNAANCETYGVKWVAVGKSFGDGSADVRGYFPRAIYCKEVKKRTFTLTYDANGGAGAPGRQSCSTAGSSCNVTMSNIRPTRTGYDFIGWADAKNGEKKYDPGKTITLSSNKTVYAVWRLKRHTLTAYAVTNKGENLENGKKIGSQTVNYGASASVGNKNISGFSFVGWCDGAKTCSNPKTVDSYSVSSLTVDKNVYAVYKPFSATSSLEIKVKNESVSKYASYQDTVYAKPGDKISYRAIYDPAAQVGYTIIPQKIRIGDGEVVANASSKSIGTLVSKWNNAFSIERKSFVSNSPLNNVYTLGDSNRVTVEKSYEIGNEVGKKLEINAKTNLNRTVQNTPKAVTMSADSGQTLATVDTSNLEDFSSVLVPYNFENQVCTEVDKNNKCVEDNNEEEATAGSEHSLSFYVEVGKRHNNLVGGEDYATKVSNGIWKIFDENNDQIASNEGDDGSKKVFNTDSKLDGKTDKIEGVKISIADKPAGSTVCYTIQFSPANSGADDNLSGGGQGEVKTRKCFKIVKKPSLQVWGGNIYSNGDITTALTSKKRLASINGGKANDNTYTFGSWGELGIISNGKVIGLASGAGLGYTSIDDDGSLVQNPGGLVGNDFCKMSTLSFANDKCSEETGSLGATLPLANDKESIKNKLENLKSDIVHYDIRDYDGGDSYIDSNIIHDAEHDGKASTLDELKKTVIYAKNIYIGCGVTRIDAVLIAEDEVNTCFNKEGGSPVINDAARSNQLKINGAVIAGKLIANRTYGAATGNDSMVPAEIINFDPTLYLWGNIGTGDDNTTNINMTTNYIRELPPRY